MCHLEITLNQGQTVPVICPCQMIEVDKYEWDIRLLKLAADTQLEIIQFGSVCRHGKKKVASYQDRENKFCCLNQSEEETTKCLFVSENCQLTGRI